jgi:uncharacterized protein YodC (DUF2158 family)
MKFKVGDVVPLKSGGPPMTVDKSLGEGLLRCKWFIGSPHELKDAEFYETSLESVGK